MKKSYNWRIWAAAIEALDWREKELFERLAVNLVDEVRRVDTPKKIIKTMGAIFDIVKAPTPDYYPANPSLYIEDALEYADIGTLAIDFAPKDDGDPVIKMLAKTYKGLTDDEQRDQFLIDFCAVKFFDNRRAGGVFYQPARGVTRWADYFGHFIATPDNMGQAEEWRDIIEVTIKQNPTAKFFYRKQAIRTVKTFEKISDPDYDARAIIEIARESLDAAALIIPRRDYSDEDADAIVKMINPDYLAEAKNSEDGGRAIKPPLLARYITGIAKFFESERSQKHE